MIMTTTITLHPRDMTSLYKDNLLREAKRTLEPNGSSQGSCTAKDGYVLEVTGLSKILKSGISTTSSMPIFEVELSVVTLKPEVGQQITGVVCMVASYCVFVLIHDKLKVLLPLASMVKAGYKFDQEGSRFVRPPSKSVKGVKISQGSSIKIVLTNVKFDKKAFICIGAPQE